MKLEGVLFSERSLEEKDKHILISLIGGIKQGRIQHNENKSLDFDHKWYKNGKKRAEEKVNV